MGTFVTATATPTIFPNGEKSRAPGVALTPGWTIDNVVAASEANAIHDALFDLRAAARGQFYNVKNYGAVGDGTTDDTTAIAAAFTACGATGGVVHFPAGTYKVTSTLTAPQAQNVVISGGGATLHGSGFTGAIIDISGNATRGIRIRDLKFQGAGQSGTVDGLYSETSSLVGLENLTFISLRYGWHIVDTHDSVTIHGLKFYQNDTDLQIDTTLSTSLKFRDCQFQLSKRSVYCSTNIVDFAFVGCGFAAARAATDSATPVVFELGQQVGLLFERCRFEQGVASDLAVTNLSVNGLSNAFPAENLRVKDCFFTGANVTTHILVGAYANETVIEGNVFYVTPTDYDIDFQATLPPTIINNVVSTYLARDPLARFPNLNIKDKDRIRLIRKVGQVTLPLGTTGTKSITFTPSSAFPNEVTHIELGGWNVPGTGFVIGWFIKTVTASSIIIQVNVNATNGTDGSFHVYAYGF